LEFKVQLIWYLLEVIYPTPASTGVVNACSGHQVYYSPLHINLILELRIEHCFQDLLKFSRISLLLRLKAEATNTSRYIQNQDCYYISQKSTEPED